MRAVFTLAWITALAAVADPVDSSIPAVLVNIAAVFIMGVIGALIKRSVTGIEKSIAEVSRRQTKTNSRLRIVELNIERIGAKHGVKLIHHDDEDDDESNEN